MRVLLTAIRGSGHLRPLLPYATALTESGHEVAVATPADAAGILAESGLRHVVTERASDAEQAAFWGGLGKVSNEEMLAIAIPELFVRMSARNALPGILAEIRAWRPDLLVRDSAEFAAVVAADLCGLPGAVVEVHNGPTEVKLYRMAASRLDDLRAEAGLPSDGGAALRRQPGFTAFPAALDAATLRPEDSPARFRVRTAPPLAADAAPRPPWRRMPDRPFVYATFGTVTGDRNLPAYRAAIDALGGLGVEGLLTTGPHVDPGALGTLPGNVGVAAFVPQAEVLGHAAAVLCHGGSGTLIGALAAGLPLVVAPLGADQPDNAATVEITGCGLSAPATDAGAVGAALARVLSEPHFGTRAGEIAGEIAALPDMADAVAALEAMV